MAFEIYESVPCIMLLWKDQQHLRLCSRFPFIKIKILSFEKKKKNIGCSAMDAEWTWIFRRGPANESTNVPISVWATFFWREGMMEEETRGNLCMCQFTSVLLEFTNSSLHCLTTYQYWKIYVIISNFHIVPKTWCIELMDQTLNVTFSNWDSQMVLTCVNESTNYKFMLLHEQNSNNLTTTAFCH